MDNARASILVVKDITILVVVNYYLGTVPCLITNIFLVISVNAAPTAAVGILAHSRILKIYYKPVSNFSSDVHPNSELDHSILVPVGDINVSQFHLGVKLKELICFSDLFVAEFGDISLELVRPKFKS